MFSVCSIVETLKCNEMIFLFFLYVILLIYFLYNKNQFNNSESDVQLSDLFSRNRKMIHFNSSVGAYTDGILVDYVAWCRKFHNLSSRFFCNPNFLNCTECAVHRMKYFMKCLANFAAMSLIQRLYRLQKSDRSVCINTRLFLISSTLARINFIDE